MSDASAIEWTDATWNPVRGCTRVSAGCKNCYAERFAERFRGVKGHPFEQGFDLRLVPEALELPFRWTKPRRVFVNSMSDLFHEDVPVEFIAQVFAVMALAGRHSFQVLTKRPERMAHLLSLFGRSIEHLERPARRMGYTLRFDGKGLVTWPLPNVWVGVSVEDQATADERIPHLLATPAAVRFVSCEPILGPVDLAKWLEVWGVSEPGGKTECSGLDWVIVGGESGLGARPCDMAWIRSLIAQCKRAGVPAFVKQLGPRPYERAEILRGEGYAGKDLLDVTQRPSLAAQREGWTRVTTKDGARLMRYLRMCDRKGGVPDEWPTDLRVRQWPEV